MEYIEGLRDIQDHLMKGRRPSCGIYGSLGRYRRPSCSIYGSLEQSGVHVDTSSVLNFDVFLRTVHQKLTFWSKSASSVLNFYAFKEKFTDN